MLHSFHKECLHKRYQISASSLQKESGLLPFPTSSPSQLYGKYYASFSKAALQPSTFQHFSFQITFCVKLDFAILKSDEKLAQNVNPLTHDSLWKRKLATGRKVPQSDKKTLLRFRAIFYRDALPRQKWNSEEKLLCIITLNSERPWFWNAHLARAWTSLLGIFFPDCLHLVLQVHKSASNLSKANLSALPRWLFMPPHAGIWSENMLFVVPQKKVFYSLYLDYGTHFFPLLFDKVFWFPPLLYCITMEKLCLLDNAFVYSLTVNPLELCRKLENDVLLSVDCRGDYFILWYNDPTTALLSH